MGSSREWSLQHLFRRDLTVTKSIISCASECFRLERHTHQLLKREWIVLCLPLIAISCGVETSCHWSHVHAIEWL